MTSKTFHGIPVPDDDLDSFAPRPSDVPAPPAHVWPPSGARVRRVGTDTLGTFSRAVYSESLARTEWMVRWDANGDVEWGYAPKQIEVLDMPKRQYPPLYARGERITGTPVKRRVRGPACEDDAELAPSVPKHTQMRTAMHINADTDIDATRPDYLDGQTLVALVDPTTGSRVDLYFDDADLMRMCRKANDARKGQ